MASETAQVLAVWKERPSFFASGLMQWVADAVGPTGPYRVAASPAFPLDDTFVADDESDDDNPYIQVRVDEMSADQRDVVERMHAEFVALLESQGWARSGGGAEWYNLQLSRGVSPSTPSSR